MSPFSHALQNTNEPMFLVTDLEPFTEYDLQVAGFNQYTTTVTNIYGPEIEVYTLEGGIILVVCSLPCLCGFHVI